MKTTTTPTSLVLGGKSYELYQKFCHDFICSNLFQQEKNLSLLEEVVDVSLLLFSPHPPTHSLTQLTNQPTNQPTNKQPAKVPSWKTVVRVAKSCVRENPTKAKNKKYIMERKAQKEKRKEKKSLKHAAELAKQTKSETENWREEEPVKFQYF